MSRRTPNVADSHDLIRVPGAYHVPSKRPGGGRRSSVA